MTYEEVQETFTRLSEEFKTAVQQHCQIVETKARNLIESRWQNDEPNK